MSEKTIDIFNLARLMLKPAFMGMFKNHKDIMRLWEENKSGIHDPIVRLVLMGSCLGDDEESLRAVFYINENQDKIKGLAEHWLLEYNNSLYQKHLYTNGLSGEFEPLSFFFREAKANLMVGGQLILNVKGYIEVNKYYIDKYKLDKIAYDGRKVIQELKNLTESINFGGNRFNEYISKTDATFLIEDTIKRIEDNYKFIGEFKLKCNID